MSNYWYAYQNQDINDYRIKCLIAEFGYQAYWIYMNLIDMSIPGNGLLQLDPKQLSVVLNCQSIAKYDELTKILNYLEEYKLIKRAPGYYLINVVRERVGSPEERLLNSKSTNAAEKRSKLQDEVMIELTFCEFCEIEANDLIEDALDKLLKRYKEAEILKATKQFAIDYAVTTHEERSKIDNLGKYYFRAIMQKLAKPSSTQQTIFEDTFLGLLKDANYFENPEEIQQGQGVYKNLLKKHKPNDILQAVTIFLSNISLNEKKIENKCGYLTATIEKILRNKSKNNI